MSEPNSPTLEARRAQIFPVFAAGALCAGRSSTS